MKYQSVGFFFFRYKNRKQFPLVFLVSHFISLVASIFSLLPPHVPLCHFVLFSCLSFSMCSVSLRVHQSCFSAGVQGMRPRRLLVSQVFTKLSAMSTRTSTFSLLLPRSQIPASLSTFLLQGHSAISIISVLRHLMCASVCEICMLVWMGSPKALLLPRNN